MAISEPILHVKAEDVSQDVKMKIEKFEASPGWLFHFRDASAIVQKHIYAKEKAPKWHENKFNADDIAFVYWVAKIL